MRTEGGGLWIGVAGLLMEPSMVRESLWECLLGYVPDH